MRPVDASPSGGPRNAQVDRRSDRVEHQLTSNVGNVAGLTSQRPLGLTTREQKVLDLVAQGRTDQRIGHLLRISHATIPKHIYDQFGTHDQLLAVNRANAYRPL